MTNKSVMTFISVNKISVCLSGIRGKIIDMIRSLCSEVKSRVKYLGRPSEDFHSYLGVRQKEHLSPFLFC